MWELHAVTGTGCRSAHVGDPYRPLRPVGVSLRAQRKGSEGPLWGGPELLPGHHCVPAEWASRGTVCLEGAQIRGGGGGAGGLGARWL